ncbi:MAG: hypothetical protein IJP31_12670 [Lachnospiraceae bacterium]|nr:hypothetical protein [Lachnospiraceae bacterium]
MKKRAGGVSVIGGAVGNKRMMRKFHHIYKDIYKYYGVTKEDMESRSERYEAIVQALSQ